MAGKQTVTIQVLADTKQFSRAMGQLSKSTGLDKVGRGARRVGNFFVGAGTAALGFGAVVGGLALKGGFTRALNIEDARAQLKGLGHDTETIDAIMGNALASVKGTAFGLDEAGTVAAQAVAAGIEPGAALERQLKLVGDSAALAKTDLGDMGSIFSKVWTAGIVQTQELNQIADRGIPIWTMLAEHYGVSGTELRKMVSQGKVDAETFATVMEDTVGGSALAMGDTTRGAWRNMMAALSRAGASFLSGVFPYFKTGLSGITDLVDRVAPHVEAAGAAFGSWVSGTAIPAIQAVLPRLQELAGEVRDRLVPFVQDLGDRFTTQVIPALQTFGSYVTGTVVPAVRDLATWVGDNRDKLQAVALGVAAAVAAFATIQQVTTWVRGVTAAVTLLNTALLANPIALVVAAIAGLTAVLVYWFTQTETGRAVWEQLQVVLETVWAAIQTAVAAVVEWFTTTAWPALQGFWTGLSEVATGVADWFTTHVTPVIVAAIDLVVAIFERMQQVFSAAWDFMAGVWDAVGGPVMAVIGVVVDQLKHMWTLAWGVIRNVLETAWNVMRKIVETALGVIRGVVQAVTAAIRGDWSGAWEAVKGIASTVWNGIKGVISSVLSGIWNTITTTLGTIRSRFSEVWTQIRTGVTEAFNRIRTIITERLTGVVTLVRGLPGRLRSALSNAGTALYSTGRNLIQGLLNGVGSLAKTIGKWFLDKVPGWIRTPLKKALGISSPSKEFAEYGRNIGQGLIVGISGMERKVSASTRGMARNVLRSWDDPELSVSASGGYGHAGASARPVYQITVQALAPTPEIGRQVVAAIRDYERLTGPVFA